MKQAYFKYILALLLFGSNGVVASLISLSSYEIVLLRSLLGSVRLIVVFFATGYRLTAFQNKKALFFLAASGLAMALDWLLLFEAYQQIGVSLGMLINYCGPAIVIALSVFLFKERLIRRKARRWLWRCWGVPNQRTGRAYRHEYMGPVLRRSVRPGLFRNGDLQQAGKGNHRRGKRYNSTLFRNRGYRPIRRMQAGLSHGN